MVVACRKDHNPSSSFQAEEASTSVRILFSQVKRVNALLAHAVKMKLLDEVASLSFAQKFDRVLTLAEAQAVCGEAVERRLRK